MNKLLIYGTTGFTGKLIAHRATQLGFDVVLAARNKTQLAAQTQQLKLPGLCVALTDTQALDDALKDATAVLNVAGPFAQTAEPMIEACLRTKTHYLDVAGEMSAFLTAQKYSEAAAQQNIMLMPGAGFVVAPSDCLALHVKQRMPDAYQLRIGLSNIELFSRGTLRAMMGLVAPSVYIRRNGLLTTVPVGRLEWHFDYGRGASVSAAVGWADVLTAFNSTAIPNIEVYAESSGAKLGLYQLGALLSESLRHPGVTWATKQVVNRWPEGPPLEARAVAERVIIAQAENRSRERIVSRMRLPDGYQITPSIALKIASNVMAGNSKPGFRTPAEMYGVDFIHQFGGIRIDDLE